MNKGCSFCTGFATTESHVGEIGLYECSSYKYKGYKYFLEVAEPEDGYNPCISRIEAFYCPICGRRLDNGKGI